MSARRRHVLLAVACTAVGLAALLRTQFELSRTLGDSMAPTLSNGDLLVVCKSAYRTADPCRGDIVLARYRGELITKRVVGLPHEEVQVEEGVLYVNGTRFPEHHLLQRGPLNIGKGMLCSGRFALLGDNRALPICLVTHGVVGKQEIIGKVVFRIRLWPQCRKVG